MKTIGVIGGIGPQATMDFERRLHVEAQRILPAQGNSGYPPLIVIYLREPPVLIARDGFPVQPLQPSPRLLQAAKQISPLCDFLVVAANGPHMFAPEIETAAGKPLLSMVNLAVGSVRERGWKRCGVLTMGDPAVYTEKLTEVGVVCETLPAKARERLDRAIIAVMEGRADEASASTAGEAVYELFGRGVAGVVLGCTELPLLLGAAADGPTFVNPAQLLAEAAVRFAIED